MSVFIRTTAFGGSERRLNDLNRILQSFTNSDYSSSYEFSYFLRMITLKAVFK